MPKTLIVAVTLSLSWLGFCANVTYFKLLIAVQTTHENVISEILDDNSEVNFDYQNPIDDTTLLMIAASHRKLCVVSQLISYGANLNLKDKWGNTVLHYAFASGCLATVNEILKNQNENLEKIANNAGLFPNDLKDSFCRSPQSYLAIRYPKSSPFFARKESFLSQFIPPRPKL